MRIAKQVHLRFPHFDRLAAPLLLAVALCVSTVIGVGCLSTRPSTDDCAKRSYSIAVLGDIHYDAPPAERFHSSNKPLNYQRNIMMWDKEMPAILGASGSLVGPDTSFALQLGDVTDGSTLNYHAHTQMLAEATSVLKKTYPNIPVISVCGNHDILGAGGKAYSDFMVPWLAKQIADLSTNVVTSTTFGFRHGPDLWIFINFNDALGTVPIVERLLADNPDTRYTFVALHGPVLPMDMWKCRWFYLGEGSQDKVRRHVRALLAQRNAIVLAGHVHSLEYKDWYGDGGRITEMVLNSVSRSKDKTLKPSEPKVHSETPADYGAWLKTAPANAANEKFNALYEEYRPGLKARFAASAFGHHILRVSDSGVVLEYYGGDALEPTKTFQLR